MSRLLHWPRSFLAAALFAALAAPASAQEPRQQPKPESSVRIPEFEQVAADMATKLSKTPRSKDGKLKVVVFVFQRPDGSTSRLGVLLANAFGAALARQIREIEFLDQALISQMGQSAELSAQQIADEDVALSLAQQAGAAVFVFGTLETLEQTLNVRVSAVRAEAHEKLYTAVAAMAFLKEWQGLELLPAVRLPAGAVRSSATTSDSSPPAGLARPGKDGIGYPQCARCPDPHYSTAARSAKYEGTVLLTITVSADGRAENVRVVKRLEHGLTEQAILAVKSWKFTPAKGPGGKPVPVEVMIEVTFRLLK